MTEPIPVCYALWPRLRAGASRSTSTTAAHGLGEAEAMLLRELVRQMEQMFPSLAATAEIQALKRDIAEA